MARTHILIFAVVCLVTAVLGERHTSRNKFLVLTAAFGGIDAIHPIPFAYREPGVDYIFVTDKTIRISDGVDLGWRIETPDIYAGELGTRTIAKYFKTQAHRAFPGYDAYLWLDASFRFIKRGHVAYMLHLMTSSNTTVVFRPHPDRQTVAGELEYCVAAIKKQTQYFVTRYGGQPMEQQVHHYTSLGFPDNVGLYAAGMFAYFPTAKMKTLFDDWWTENLEWTIQDQLSFPFVLWKHDVRVAPTPSHSENVGNPFVTHKNHDKII